MSFQLGYALLAVSIIAAFSWHSAGTSGNFGFINLVLGLMGLFFTTSLASLAYELMPWFQYVQFPWRFLGVATLFFAAFTGLSTCSDLAKRYPWTQNVLMGAVIFLCFVFSMNQRAVNQKTSEDLDRLEKSKIEERSVGILGNRNEFRPRWFPLYAPYAFQFNQVIALDPSTQVKDIATRGSTMMFKVAKGDNAPITISWFFFPGWQAEVDGVREPVAPVPSGRYRGFVSIPASAGTHTVKLWFGSTWPRISGWLVACFTVIIMTALAKYKGQRSIIH
jgi:hypothetical protein